MYFFPLQSTIGRYKDQYNISWTVTSFSAIREYRLFYRKQSAHSLPHDVNFENQVVPFLYTHSSAIPNDQWENIVIPEIFDDYGNHYSYSHHIPQNIRHSRTFLIKNLEPGTHYEARVQARNDHGWNKLSSIFHFTTRSEGESCPALLLAFTPVF